ncbi:MAG: SDR family NAD(P)-dependent oxidoreductase [Lactobacillales bacterium]|jgi:short-subunit dehydrogenase involved in D-alanine esterification of teichoic acids|nr:SDR family NAD(P)-dependent oxidoreductase [Lactobacillales bacterium]
MSFDFSGKRVFVTGGTCGIGLAVARNFVESGAEVIIFGSKKSSVEQVVQLFDKNIRGIVFDLRNQ